MNRNQRLRRGLALGLIHAKRFLGHEVAGHAKSAGTATQTQLVEFAEPTLAFKLIDVA
jgi:hypothetical protein